MSDPQKTGGKCAMGKLPHPAPEAEGGTFTTRVKEFRLKKMTETNPKFYLSPNFIRFLTNEHPQCPVDSSEMHSVFV